MVRYLGNYIRIVELLIYKYFNLSYYYDAVPTVRCNDEKMTQKTVRRQLLRTSTPKKSKITTIDIKYNMYE